MHFIIANCSLRSRTAELVSGDQNESYGQLDKVQTKTLKEITEMDK